MLVGLPMDINLNAEELEQFKVEIDKKRKKIKLFCQPGLPRKVRLCSDYMHTNSRDYSKKGTRCALCSSILKQDNRSTTAKGCYICCVPLCSANAAKFENPEESCEYRWHKFLDLESLDKPKLKPQVTKKKTITQTVAGAVDTLLSLRRQRRSKRQR